MRFKLPTVTVTDMARAVAAMLRGMKVERVRALVGVGLGGIVALRLAALFPELVTAVVVLGAARALPEPLRERLGLTVTPQPIDEAEELPTPYDQDIGTTPLEERVAAALDEELEE